MTQFKESTKTPTGVVPVGITEISKEDKKNLIKSENK